MMTRSSKSQKLWDKIIVSNFSPAKFDDNSSPLSAYPKTDHVIPEIFNRESINTMQQWIPANGMREWRETVRFSDLKLEVFG